VNAKNLIRSVSDRENEIVESFCTMLRINAVGPENGGPGEGDRARYLLGLLRDLGFEDVQVYESSDPSAKGGKRPNIVVSLKGSSSTNLWVVTHMDTVPEGDLSAWKYPPFDAKVVDGRVYGRGSEDNGQELIASLYGLHAVLKAGITPECKCSLVFVCDEEHGNVHGIEFLLSKGIFKEGDLVVVPDHGGPDGAAMAVVEKGIAWINVEVIGRQTHGSTPHKGVNALEVAARFMVAAVDTLRSRFSICDPLFDPPCSTFELTRCDSNGPNVNTVPGRQSFSFDFRVLPEYSLDTVMAELQSVAKEFEKSAKAKINLTYLQKAPSAVKTRADSEVVMRLSKAIETARGVKPHPMGIGGGTCANPFRREGIEAVVWSTIRETAHDANEYAEISDLIADAQVYALLFAGSNVARS